MNTKLFSEAMSEVNDKYYEEAENYHCPKNRWIKFASLAACAAIVLAVSFATLWKQFPGQALPQPENNPPVITNPNEQWDNPEQVISLDLNEISAPDAVIHNIIFPETILPQYLMKNCSIILMYLFRFQKHFPTLHSRAQTLASSRQKIVVFIMMEILLCSKIPMERRASISSCQKCLSTLMIFLI